MGGKGWFLGNSPHGLCSCAGLQAHPAVSRDRVAPERTRGDGAGADLLAAGEVGCGRGVGVPAGLAAWQRAEVHSGAETALVVQPEVLVLATVTAGSEESCLSSWLHSGLGRIKAKTAQMLLSRRGVCLGFRE